jgi:hypothetical protein
LTNRANVRLQEAKRNEFAVAVLELLNLKILGDDLVRFIRVVDKWTVELADKVMTTHMDVSTSNGFQQQRTKSVMRLHYYEFLKKTFVYGRHIPLMQMQPFAGEKPDENIPMVERMRGYAAKMQTVAMRGFDHDLAMRIMVWTFCLRRGVRMLERGFNRIYYVPMAVLFTPSAWGGVGLVPFTLHAGASLDGLIATYCATDDDWKRRAERAGGIMDVRGESTVKRVARMIAKGEGTDPIGVFEPGVQFVRDSLIGARVGASMRAEIDMRRAGMRPPADMAYSKLPERVVENMIASEPLSECLSSSKTDERVVN